ncbi:MAG: peptidoglycan DD-metalloendopeptidase family protein [Pseudomonadota bacterium]
MPSAPTYTVLGGDTLYSIAFRYGMDYKRLAAANEIPSPYTIFAGQRLLLEEATLKRSQASAATISRASESKLVKRSASTPTATKPAPSPPSNTKNSNTAPQTAINRESTPNRPEAFAPKKSDVVDADSWRWPASGRVVRRFDGQLQKGIDIAGDRGAPVAATAGGSVVYAGSGIAGYGLMLIVRHNDEYLSAYGHNERLLVREGDLVGVGQTIAELGSSGTDTVKLHFEIRRRGKPVNPLALLPKR